MRISRLGTRIVRRTASVVPAAVIRAVVRALGPAAAPAVGLPDAARVLVFAPHPDDESIGCGGTLTLASRAGAEVTVAFVTDGEAMLVADAPSNVGRRRRDQAVAACTILGAQAKFLGLADGRLAGDDPALMSALEQTIAEVRPDVVLLPWFGDANADHRAVNDSIANARLDEPLRIWGYEVWSPLPANRVVDISSVIDDKARAISAHTADVFLDPQAVLGLHRFRASAARITGTHAEAFFEASAREYADWIRSSRS